MERKEGGGDREGGRAGGKKREVNSEGEIEREIHVHDISCNYFIRGR